MKCKDIQDLILTDYIDSQLSREHRIMVEGHLQDCPECARLMESVQSLNKELAQAGEVQIDRQKVWQKVAGKIKSRETSNSIIYTPKESRPNFLSGLLQAWKPSLALAALAGVIFIGAFYFTQQQRQLAKIGQEDEVQYLASLILIEEASVGEEHDETEESLVTDIEAYFL